MMDKYTLQEQAYKNGYSVGFAEGANRGKANWIYADSSEIICSGCGTRQAKFYGDGCAVPRNEQNFCHYCGCVMTYKLL
jgi:hypothetical protein